MSEDPLGYAAGDANLYRYAAGDPVNNVDPDGRIAVYAFWAGVNATLDTAIETGFTYAFGTDEQKANYSIRGTLGKNFAINLATGGLGNKIKWLGRGGQYAFRVAADVLIGTSYDVYANNQDVSTALVSNSLGTAGGEVLGALARRGGRYLAHNFQFDTDVLRGAAPTSGFNPFPFRRRAQVGYSQSYAANFDAAFDSAAAVPIPRSAVAAELPILNPEFSLDPTKVIGSHNAYSTAFRTTLPPSAYPGKPYGFHFQQANRQLIQAMDADPGFSQQIESLIPGVRDQLINPRSFSGEPPGGWTWHHHVDTGVLELVPRVQHEAAGQIQQLFHPGGQGGMNIWGR